jgi:hypothetical protein
MNTLPVNFDGRFYAAGMLFGFVTTLLAGYFPSKTCSQNRPGENHSWLNHQTYIQKRILWKHIKSFFHYQILQRARTLPGAERCKL